ncbi:regulator of chromosome condensation domain-containing protein [Cyclospora cayetanensis]|uniref:Regulator of chromosome condensation domain-containing protein n=1 Tax=Cyclospora cayetanensis TaxID=88456 RepID=A0A1D3D500_9EIME|nr:regulator of chromosome condensation domain-containing protein [Cyclospora cayetanensis]
MKRLIPCARRSSEDQGVGQAAATFHQQQQYRCLIDPSYSDTRTVIYIWGRRLLEDSSGEPPDGEGGAQGGGGRPGSSSSSSSKSLCQPVVLRSLQDVRVVEVAVGETHALFLSDGGKLFAYGEGAYGQLGRGQVQLMAHTPQRIPGIEGSVVQIAAGDFHSLALSDDGAVYAWGAADCVGDGSGTCAFSPRLLRLSSALPTRGTSSPVCRRLAARYAQSMALMAGGHLLVWGHAIHARYFQVPRLTFVFDQHHKVMQLALGKAFALALTGLTVLMITLLCAERGEVLAWGDGTYGELAGHTSRVGSTLFEVLSLKDANNQPLPPIVSISAGARHALLIAQDLRLWAFGDNLAGQCGVPGHQTKLNTPKVRSLEGSLSCGVLSRDGKSLLREGEAGGRVERGRNVHGRRWFARRGAAGGVHASRRDGHTTPCHLALERAFLHEILLRIECLFAARQSWRTPIARRKSCLRSPTFRLYYPYVSS